MAKISGTNGIVLFGSQIAISNATGNAGTVTVTASGHSFAAGDRVRITGVAGMTDLNGGHSVVTSSVGSSFTVALQTSQTYSSGTDYVQACFDVTEFNLDLKIDVADTTDSTNAAVGYKAFLAKAFSEGSGTFGGFRLQATNGLTLGSPVTIILSLDAGNNYYSGGGIITSDATTLQISGTEAVKASYAFQMSGTITKGTGV